MWFILIMISPGTSHSRSSPLSYSNPHPFLVSLIRKQTNIKARQPNEILKIKICKNLKKKQEIHIHQNTQRKLEIII